MDKKTATKKTLWPLALVIFVVALLARLAYLIDFSASPVSTYFILDPQFYNQAAIDILNGTLTIHQATFKAPLYPYFLAAIYSITGIEPFAARLIQSVMGSLSCVMVFYLALRFYSRGIAIAAGLIAALYGPFILFDNEILIPTLIVFLDLASFLLLFRYEDNGNRWLLFASGLLLGLSALARPNVLIVLPGIILWLWRYISRRRRRGWLRQAAFYCAGVVVMLVILFARNYAVTGQPHLFGNYSGYNFLIGNNRFADGKTAVLAGTSVEFEGGYRDAVRIANTVAGRTLDDREVNDVWLKMGLDYITTNPLDWLWLEVRKLVYLASGFELPNNRHIYFFAERSPVLAPLVWDKFIAFPFGILLPLALVAVFAGLVRRNQYPLIFFLIAYSVSILLFFVNARYRLPMVPILIIWGTAGAWHMVGLWKKKDFLKFYRLLVLFLVAVLLCNGLTFLPPFKTRPPSEYESHLHLGSAYFQEGDYEDARVELLTAARLYPKSPMVYNALGNTFQRLGRDSLATVYYQKCIEVDPNNQAAARSLADVYKRYLTLGELNDLLLARFERNPNEVWAIMDYAWLHIQIDAKEEALDIYQRAYDADTTYYEALFRKAQLYLDLDMRADAEQEFKFLLQRFPNSVEIHGNLAQIYARQRRIDDAIREFTWVRNQDPTHPGSYFNLASVYLQAGKLDLAEQNLDRVVQLAPDFPAIDRLREAIAQARADQAKSN
ncbi:MAG: tetratricopeptide repeat protein [bacterium]